MLLGNLGDDGKPKPAALGQLFALAPIKAFQHSSMLGLGNAGAIVADL